MKIIPLLTVIGLAAGGPALAADALMAEGRYVLALAGSENQPPRVLFARLNRTKDNQFTFDYADQNNNKRSIPVHFRSFSGNDGRKVTAFDGYFEQKDGADPDRGGIYSLRLAGVVMPDGSASGTLIQFTTVGYQGSAREVVGNYRFELRPNNPEEIQGKK